MVSIRSSVAWCICLSMIAGCGGPGAEDVSAERLASMAGGTLEEVVPVSGKVTVNGEPKPGVNLYLYNSDGTTRISTSRTAEDGTYCWSTNTMCDGIKAGSYRLAFRYIPKPKKNDSDESALDQFKGAYSNPSKVEYLLTVTAGTPQTEVNYDLKLE